MKQLFFSLICLTFLVTLSACKDRTNDHHERYFEKYSRTIVNETAQAIGVNACHSIQIGTEVSQKTPTSPKKRHHESDTTIIDSIPSNKIASEENSKPTQLTTIIHDVRDVLAVESSFNATPLTPSTAQSIEETPLTTTKAGATPMFEQEDTASKTSKITIIKISKPVKRKREQTLNIKKDNKQKKTITAPASLIKPTISAYYLSCQKGKENHLKTQKKESAPKMVKTKKVKVSKPAKVKKPKVKKVKTTKPTKTKKTTVKKAKAKKVKKAKATRTIKAKKVTAARPVKTKKATAKVKKTKKSKISKKAAARVTVKGATVAPFEDVSSKKMATKPVDMILEEEILDIETTK